MGLEVQPIDDQDCTPDAYYHIWPENIPVWQLWWRIQTLWRVGMQGRDGLDYAGLCAYLREVERIKPRKFAAVFSCVQAMEYAALEAWARQREKNK